MVTVNPTNDLITLVKNILLIFFVDFVLELLILNSRLHVESVALDGVLSGDAVAMLFILFLLLFGITCQLLDLFLAQTT